MSANDWVKSAIEVLDIIAWPAVVIWLGYLFPRTQLPEALKDAVKRGFEVAFGGVKVAVSAALPAQTPPPPTEGVPAVPRTDSPQPTPPAADTASLPPPAQQYIASVRSYFSPDQLEPQVQAVRKDLLKIGGADLTSQVEALVYSLASANLQLGHERVYSAIYGSQLRLLALANPEAGASEQFARQIYEEAKAAFPGPYSTFTFAQWIAFLINGWLLARQGENLENLVLTPYGRGFLKFIVDRRLPTNKPF